MLAVIQSRVVAFEPTNVVPQQNRWEASEMCAVRVLETESPVDQVEGRSQGERGNPPPPETEKIL